MAQRFSGPIRLNNYYTAAICYRFMPVIGRFFTMYISYSFFIKGLIYKKILRDYDVSMRTFSYFIYFMGRSRQMEVPNEEAG